MFDMQAIGRRISAMRKNCNMTQTELADRLGISYQAVSNWERGNSMPDIEKLPELADIFACSVDELLGRKSPLVESAMKDSMGEYVRRHEVTPEELQEALPILKPDQVHTLVKTLQPERIREMEDSLSHLGDAIDTRVQEEMGKVSWLDEEHIDALLPFMESDDVRDFAAEYAAAGQSIAAFLPFMDEADLYSLAQETSDNGGSIAMYLPFLSHDHVSAFARQAKAKGESLSAYLPFLDTPTVTAYARELAAQGESIASYLPFLPGEEVARLAQEAFDAGKSVSAYLPFMPTDEVSRLAAAASARGDSIDSYLPFIDRQELIHMAMHRFRETMSGMRAKKGGRHEE